MGLGWCLAVHYVPGEDVPVSLVPENLIARGPYRLSRNPMYVCEQMVLLGWTLYFGNAGLLAASMALGAGMRYAVIREERTLARRFGDSWHEYAAKVPRWIRPSGRQIGSARQPPETGTAGLFQLLASSLGRGSA